MRPAPRRAEERAFLQAVVYAALFDYPLTLAQVRETLVGHAADEATLMQWYRHSHWLRDRVDFLGGYFFPRGRRDLLVTRACREATSRALLRDLSAPLHLATRMPFVRMVAVSGSLAHLNGTSDADLDLFVITRPRRVWTVTVALLTAARLMGWRRRLCLNYVVSERAMWVAPADLFSANQIVHLQPLVGGATYTRFLDANRFVERFYPNFAPRQCGDAPTPAWRRLAEQALDIAVGPFVEPVCRWIYRAHLRRRAHTWTSRDQVRLEPECLKLHTSSHRRRVLERFEAAVDAAERSASPPLRERVTVTAGGSPPLPGAP